jgi:hypothetical protein
MASHLPPTAEVRLPHALGVVLRVTIDGAVSMHRVQGTPDSLDVNGSLQASFFKDGAQLRDGSGREVESLVYGQTIAEDSKWLKWLKQQGFVVRL